VCGGWAATRRRRDRAEPGRRRDAGQAPPQLNLVWKKIDSGNHALDLERRGKIGRREVMASLGRRDAPPLCRGRSEMACGAGGENFFAPEIAVDRG